MTWVDFNTVPPGGWRYAQNADNGAFLKRFQSYNTYGMFIDDVVDFRKANHLKRATNHEADEDVQTFMCNEFGNDPRYCADGSKKNSPIRLVRTGLAGVARAAGRLYDGARILAEWLGQGAKAVPVAQAQARADVCSGRISGHPCPHNSDSATASWITGPVSEAISQQLDQKGRLKLAVEGEQDLHFCNLCLCPLKLKVWVPMQTILHHFPDKMLELFRKEAPADCWVNTENKPQTPAQ